MPEENPHTDLGAYVLGDLEPDEVALFESHLATCAHCRDEMVSLRRVNELLDQAGPPVEAPPVDLGARVLAAVEREADEPRSLDEHRSASRGQTPGVARRRSRQVAAAIGIAAALVAGIVLGSALDDRPGGEVEIETVLAAPSGTGATASIRVVAQGIGRVISLRSDDLPILPTGEFYELWFVGPGDTLATPNRISAGTFHPDENGRSVVDLTAAVDPTKYPVLSVTAEPGDGNPERTGPEVLRSDEQT